MKLMKQLLYISVVFGALCGLVRANDLETQTNDEQLKKEIANDVQTRHQIAAMVIEQLEAKNLPCDKGVIDREVNRALGIAPPETEHNAAQKIQKAFRKFRKTKSQKGFRAFIEQEVRADYAAEGIDNPDEWVVQWDIDRIMNDSSENKKTRTATPTEELVVESPRITRTKYHSPHGTGIYVEERLEEPSRFEKVFSWAIDFVLAAIAPDDAEELAPNDDTTCFCEPDLLFTGFPQIA